MQLERALLFHSFCLDLANAQLWRNGEEIVLRRKTFEVLRYLVEHPGQLVTKDALLDTVWAGVTVGDSMPTICVGELRRALGDEAKTPQLIETVHGRGYRFIAKVTSGRAAQLPAQPSLSSEPAPIVVGREHELDWLRGKYDEALAGRRRVIFVAGEPGIGKTTFVRAFLNSLAGDDLLIGHGQCVEQYGAGEPYMPIFEALTRLAQQSGGGRIIEILNQLAPSWLAQMPSLLSDSERERLQSAAQGVTQPRMLREMGAALDAMTPDKPLVLLLEDLHWSDFSTLDLIAAIARRTESARLLIVGTYRPVEILASHHPLRVLKAELELHRYCAELRLKLLNPNDVAAYLIRRFAEDQQDALVRAAPIIHARTEGNPLFMVNVVDYLVERGSLFNAGTIEAPPNIQQMIERNFERLAPQEQAILRVASAAGAEFSAAAIAAALDQPTDEVEMRCVQLARQQQFIESAGASEWPDGTVASRFRFHHALYGDVLYERLPIGHRIELHRKIAARQETAYGIHAAEVAVELAHHYAQARESEKAVKYHQLAGKQAVKRSANREAVMHFTAALETLENSPQTEEVIRQKLRLYVFLQTPLVATTGYTSPQVKEVCERARSLARQIGDSPQLFAVLGGLCSIHLNRGELRLALELGQEGMRMAESSNNPVLLLWAHYTLGFALEALGEYQQSREQLERSVALYDRNRAGSYGFVQDPGPTGLLMLAVVVSRLGFLDLAWRHATAGLELARELSHSFTLGWVLNTATFIHMERGELDEAAALSDEGVILCTNFGFDELLEGAIVWQGRIMVGRGEARGIARIQEGLALAKSARRAANLGLLSEGYRRLGNSDLGLATVVGALAALEEERCLAPWLLRLKGDLLLDINPPDSAEAERLFCESIEVARSQNDKLDELTTTLSLARLVAKRDRERARAMLAEIYNWFTEGFDTAPLKEAKALLDQLSEPAHHYRNSRKSNQSEVSKRTKTSPPSS